MFYMMTDHLSEAYKSIYQRKDLTSPPKDAEGMTGKMNPQGEPKAAQGGDHANAPESMVRGRYRAAYEEYKDDLRDHHLEKFTKWMETISEGGYDITRWEKEELIETYIKENNLWESREIVFEAVESFDLQENRRAARAAGASKDDTKKQPDPSKDGFTGIGNMSIDAIRKMSARIEKEKTNKEEVENVEELYKGKHGQSDKEYADSRSQGGKMISGDSKRSGAEYTHGRRVKAANPGMQPDVGGKTKPKSQGKMDRGTRADLEYRKANLKKEEASMSPQELQLQKKKARIDKMIAMKRQQGLAKQKAGDAQPAKAMGEATEDSLRDRRMERGGVDGNVRYDKAPKFAPGPAKKSSGSEKAIDFVRKEITAKYGKGALIDTKKKK